MTGRPRYTKVNQSERERRNYLLSEAKIIATTTISTEWRFHLLCLSPFWSIGTFNLCPDSL